MLPFESLSVAPMEGVTTFPTRLWLHLIAQPVAMTTPFLRVTQVYPEKQLPPDFAPELFELHEALPYRLTPQFICGDPELFLRITDLLPDEPVIELNCGCPSPNSMGRFAGSGILQNPEFFARSMERLATHMGPGRFAIKMRLGITESAEFPALLRSIADLPLHRLTVHGRTRAAGYRGIADWSAIENAALHAKSQVLASGDIWGLSSLEKLHHVAPSVAGAMVGRGLLRNPWIFAEIRHKETRCLSPFVLAHALLCFAMLHDVWQKHPRKLLQKVSSGRIGFPCGEDEGAWEKLATELSPLVFGYPLLVDPREDLPKGLSPVAASRLKMLWTYLRSSLPDDFEGLTRVKSVEVFLPRIFQHAPATFRIGHRPDRDELFQGARG